SSPGSRAGERRTFRRSSRRSVGFLSDGRSGASCRKPHDGLERRGEADGRSGASCRKPHDGLERRGEAEGQSGGAGGSRTMVWSVVEKLTVGPKRRGEARRSIRSVVRLPRWRSGAPCRRPIAFVSIRQPLSTFPAPNAGELGRKVVGFSRPAVQIERK